MTTHYAHDHEDVLFHQVSPQGHETQAFLLALHGTESLSQPYTYEAVLLVPEELSEAEVDAWLGAQARLSFPSTAARLQGMVRAIELLPSSTPDDLMYLVTLVPNLWRLSQTRRTRVYLQRTVPEIVGDVLKAHGLDTSAAFRLTAGYPARPFTMQYRETDLDFVQRLLECVGVTYHFEHDGARERVVFTDDGNGWSDRSALPYNDLGPGPAVRQVARRRSVVPRTCWVRDYHDDRPDRVQMNTAGHPVDSVGWPSASGVGGLISLDEDLRPDRSQRMATVRAQELRGPRDVLTGRTDLRPLRSGDRFALTDHFHPGATSSLNGDWLAVRVTHHAIQRGREGATARFAEALPHDVFRGASAGNEGESYFNRFEAVPWDRGPAHVFRPARVTPCPTVPGVLRGVIAGPSGSVGTPIDAEGRYRVRLCVDTSEDNLAQPSLPVRMLQSLSGPEHGIHFPLHAGAEVAVAFVDGDPDRPVIVGAVPNPRTVSPIVAPDDVSRNRIRTRSGIELEFDDDAR